MALCKFEDELVITNTFDYQKRKELFEKLGDGSCKLKSFTKGIDFYLKMLEAARLNGESERQMTPIYVSLYQTFKDIKDYDSALEYMNKEYEVIKDEPKEACATLLALGNLTDLAGRDFWEVDTIYRRGIEQARKAKDTAIEKALMLKLIKLCKKQSMISLAEILEREAIEKGFDLSEASDELSEEITDICDISLELELSTDPESSENEDNRLSKTNLSARKRRPTMAVKRNAKGETRLHEACINGNYQLVRLLIDQGHAINVRDYAGWLPLHEAAIHGFSDIVELLLDNGATINDKGGTKCDGITPLYDAASNGNLAVVQLLLDRGAKATMRTDFNETPLDALMRWFEDYGKKLSSGEAEFFETIRKRLSEKCERVGIEATTSKNPGTSSSGYSSAKSRNSQTSQKRSLRHNTSFSSESEQEESSKENDQKKTRIEYRNVMNRLKNRNLDQMYFPETSNEGKKRSAHLTAEEIDPDEWLDDDLGPSKKKQKNRSLESSFRNDSPVKRVTSARTVFRAPPLNHLIDSDSENETGVQNTFDENPIDAFDIIMNAGNDTKKKSKTRRESTTKPFERQPTLLDAGFARITDREEAFVISPIKISSSCSTLKESHPRLSSEEKSVVIKVKVENEKIIVPINKDAVADLQISWLIQETARRYYCLKGIQPELELKTSDGAKFLPSDPVSVILSLAENNLIHSEILDWKLPSLSKRYLEACSDLKCNVDTNINEFLEINHSSAFLDLSNQNLNPSAARPIFKALQHQSGLDQLNLSTNFLQNDGIKYLSQTVTTLKQLSLLDISGNCVTENGVEYLCNSLLKCESFRNLKKLVLSFNPIRSASMKLIGAICASKKIESLSVVYCELKDAFRLEYLSSLKHLDISYNFLSSDAVRDLLHSLNASAVETLNFERFSAEGNLGNFFVIFINAGCYINLREINFAGLKFSENELLDVIRALEKCEKLESLDLSYHKQMTILVFKYLLFSFENKSLERLKLIECRNLQSTAELMHLQGERRETSLRNIQLTVPKDATKGDFIEKLRELWETLNGYHCGHHFDRDVLHLIRFDDDRFR